MSEEFTRICHTRKEFVRIIHMCDKYVRILHTCDRFVRMWKSNESVTSVKKAISFTRDPLKYKFGGSNGAWPPRRRLHGDQWLQTEKPGTELPNSIIWPEFN